MWHVSVCLPVCLSVSLSVCLFVYLSVCILAKHVISTHRTLNTLAFLQITVSILKQQTICEINYLHDSFLCATEFATTNPKHYQKSIKFGTKIYVPKFGTKIVVPKFRPNMSWHKNFGATMLAPKFLCHEMLAQEFVSQDPPGKVYRPQEVLFF